MIESEFDKYVRDLLQNAEEEVSPRVWEGVAAGLAKKRRVVPVWGWAAWGFSCSGTRGGSC